MYLSDLQLRNWGPYYGDHKLQLTDTVYAVQAQHEQDEERSNWLGKSWFIGAIRFLLTGVHPATSADGWISWGEKSGEVSGKLSDGTTISRTRSLGRSTQLVVRIPGMEEARQDKAQDVLITHIGMADEDLTATCFIEQREIARLVLADPAERARVVNGWLKLDSLLKAEEWLRLSLQKCLTQERSLGGAGNVEGMQAEITTLEQTIATSVAEQKALEVKLQGQAAQARNLAEWRQHYVRSLRFPAVQTAGKRTAAELEKVGTWHKDKLVQLESNVDRWLEHKSRKADRVYQVRELVDGDWDGTCPKTCEACPVQKDVRAVGASMEVELRQAEADLDQDAAELDTAKAELEALRTRISDKVRLTQELDRLRTEGTELLVSVDYIEEHGNPPEDGGQEATQRAELERFQQVTQAIAEAAIQKASLEAQVLVAKSGAEARQSLQAQARTLQEAIAVVGRQGAQREVAEGALGTIELGANKLLQSAGIDLQVEVQWSREGDGLALYCDSCGAAFPKSQAVKVCGICNAQRGPKQVEKLTLAPNDRSGAADDIAGLAFQLSASAWLRNERLAAWSVACIDEPFGQLDRANAKALSAHLHAMIRGSYAFSQGFIVAHDRSIMEALPACVQVLASEHGSKLEVR